MEKVYLSLGSNLGDRRANILSAVGELDRSLGRPHSAISSLIETSSWGFEGADFINCAVLYETELPPEELHAARTPNSTLRAGGYTTTGSSTSTYCSTGLAGSTLRNSRYPIR